jgi:hypothetical protein
VNISAAVDAKLAIGPGGQDVRLEAKRVPPGKYRLECRIASPSNLDEVNLLTAASAAKCVHRIRRREKGLLKDFAMTQTWVFNIK